MLPVGIEVLYDDRDERAGVKFNDADLLGIPLRITISRRTLRDAAIELKARQSGDLQRVPLAGVIALVRDMVQHPSSDRGPAICP